MGLSKEIKQKRKGLKNFGICFPVSFSYYDRNVISGRESGHLSLLPTDFEIFLFLKFLRA